MNLIPRSFFFDDDLDDLMFPAIKRNDMKCDIYEKDNMYHIEMDVPGYNKEDINIEVKDGYLTVSASKTKEDSSEDKNYIRRERVSGTFSRTFSLGDIDVNSITAKFENGILTIVMPKQEVKENNIKINID